jgi:hypothetical protein
MVETITPVVHGGRGRWLGALTLHTAGATVTAAAFGAVLGAIGALLGAPFGRAGLVALAVSAAAYAAADHSGRRVPIPQLRRQVPDWWRTFFGRPVAAALYGAGLGIGFFTYLAHGTLVVVAGAAFAGGRPALGALLMAPFGLVRGLSAATAWDATSPERGRALVDRLAAIPDRRRRVTNAAALGAAASLAAWAAIVAGPGGWWELLAAALGSVFAWAAASKLVAPGRWRRALGAHALADPAAGIARWGVPVAEAFVPALVVLGRPRAAGVWATALVLGFTLEILRIRPGAAGRVPCGCFGSRSTVRTSTALLRNAALAAAGILVAIRGSSGEAIAWPARPVASDVVPLALALGSLAVTGLLVWRAAAWLAPSRGRDGSTPPASARWGRA